MKYPDKTKFTILVIDDSEELLEVFKLIFEMQGYQLIAKNSSTDITSFVKANKIDLLLLDVVLNKANGRDVCRNLKSNPITDYFPIVLMSASPDDLHDLDECFADDCLEKPFDIGYIEKKISSLIQSKVNLKAGLE